MCVCVCVCVYVHVKKLTPQEVHKVKGDDTQCSIHTTHTQGLSSSAKSREGHTQRSLEQNANTSGYIYIATEI